MIGNSDNKIKKQKGQVLLLIIMLVSTILSVIVASSFRSTTETQLTKLEEESQKAFAAAEAGIEVALKEGSIADINTLSGFEGYSGSAIVEDLMPKTFTTPFLQKDEQYTLYLSTPADAPDNPNFTQLGEPYFNGDLTLCFNGSTAIEITMINADHSINRFIINPSSASFVLGSDTIIAKSGCPLSNFSYSHTFSSISNTKLLIARVVNGATKLGFSASTSLPYQGRVVSSKATTPAGVKKEIVLFQSYPQIPLEFFVTSF